MHDLPIYVRYLYMDKLLRQIAFSIGYSGPGVMSLCWVDNDVLRFMGEETMISKTM